jgi:phospholipase D1/2
VLQALPAEVQDPSSQQCMKLVTDLANDNWAHFVSSEVSPLPHGHLMTYPEWVDSSGQVSALPDCEEFPGRV